MTEKNTLEVGSNESGVFIVFSQGLYDRGKTSLGDKPKHVLRNLNPDDVEWLIASLKKEIGQ